MSLNRVELIGGVTRDVQVQSFGWGDLVELALAVNGTRYDSERREQVVATTYVTVVVLGAQAAKVLKAGIGKGDEVYVLGELDQKTVTKPDGSKDSKTRVTARMIEPVRVRAKQPGGTPTADLPPLEPGEEPF